MYKRVLLLLLPMLVINYSLLLGEVRFVSKTGSSTPPYTSWATAADSIQKCINFSQSGDTIYVGNGVYKEQIVMIPGLALIGSGMDSCVIDTKDFAVPQDFISVRVKENGTFEGFHIIVSDNNWGTGIYLRHTSGQKLIANAYRNKISDSNIGIWLKDVDRGVCSDNIIFGTGRGIYINNFYDSQPIVEDNYISEVTNIGISISFGGSSIIRNNIIVDDDLTYGFIGGAQDTLYLMNNLLLVNNARAGGLILGNSKILCFNNVVEGTNNKRGIDGRINNYIYNNTVTSGNQGIRRFPDEAPVIKYNNSWNNAENYSNFNPDSTNLSVDPMFMDVANNDFHLQAYSPLIDAGNPLIRDIDETRSDIGYLGGPYGKKYSYIDLPPKAPRNTLATLDSGMVRLRWNKNTEADLRYYKIYRDTVPNFTINTANLLFSTEDTTFSEPIIENKNIYYKITAVDGTENESLPGEEVPVIAVGVDEPKVVLENYILYQNYPNPFNPSTTIGYRLNKEAYVKLNVYDIKGEKIKELVNEYKNPGYYEVDFEDASVREGHASGIYLYKMDVFENGTPLFSEIKKMAKIK